MEEVVKTCNELGIDVIVMDEETDWDNLPCFGALMGRCGECEKKSYNGHYCIVVDGVFQGYEPDRFNPDTKIRWDE